LTNYVLFNSFGHEVAAIEEEALRQVSEIILKKRDELQAEFKKCDVNSTGVITLNDWVTVMNRVMNLGWIPWRSIKRNFIQVGSATHIVAVLLALLG
jgi:Ca2+-binding EF-hand superfamily protein